jgi:putative ubiquitin-RnfH superfamily antitoxin RatB of RatAB toxin-antitoxin module
MARIRIEVVYAQPAGEDLMTVELAAGATVGDALQACGVLLRHAEIDLRRHRIGVYGRLVEQGAVLRDGDRVEIYRPLVVNAKEARRRRALGKA